MLASLINGRTKIGNLSDSEDIAAIIVEPVNGNTGCIPSQNNFLNDLKGLCSRAGSLLIFDLMIFGWLTTSCAPRRLTAVLVFLIFASTMIAQG